MSKLSDQIKAEGAGNNRPPRIVLPDDPGSARRCNVSLTGDWLIAGLSQIDDSQYLSLFDHEDDREANKIAFDQFNFDLSGISAIDPSGAWAISRLTALAEQNGARVKLIGKSAEMDALLLAVAPFQAQHKNGYEDQADLQGASMAEMGRNIISWLPMRLGRVMNGVWRDTVIFPE